VLNKHYYKETVVLNPWSGMWNGSKLGH